MTLLINWWHHKPKVKRHSPAEAMCGTCKPRTTYWMLPDADGIAHLSPVEHDDHAIKMQQLQSVSVVEAAHMERVLSCRVSRSSHLRLQSSMGWRYDTGRRPAQRPQHAQRRSSAISAWKTTQRAALDCLQQGLPRTVHSPPRGALSMGNA